MKTSLLIKNHNNNNKKIIDLKVFKINTKMVRHDESELRR